MRRGTPRCQRCRKQHGVGARCLDLLPATATARQARVVWRNDHGAECTCFECVMARIGFVRKGLV